MHHKVIDVISEPVYVPRIIAIHKDALVVDTGVGKRVDIVVHVEFLELSLECSHGLVALR